jgi:trehalose synthase
MSLLLERYAEVAGRGVIDQIEALARPLRGLEVVHVNSTRSGGGVAEILAWMVPLLNELGLSARWEVVNGDGDYFECTKSFHNGLQGYPVALTSSLLRAYEQTNEANAERLRDGLRKADLVVVHDPQPAPLLGLIPDRRGIWIWRCHIDASRPNRAVWKYLRRHVAGYDASIFSLPDFTQRLPHRQFLIPPSIDPLSEKNIELGAEELESVRSRFNLDPDRPLVTQISRFDQVQGSGGRRPGVSPGQARRAGIAAGPGRRRGDRRSGRCQGVPGGPGSGR